MFSILRSIWYVFLHAFQKRITVKIALVWEESLQTLRSSLLQTPESRTYMSRGDFLEGRAISSVMLPRFTTHGDSFGTNTVWIATMDAGNAAHFIGRTRPGNSSLTIEVGSRRPETIGGGIENRSSQNLRGSLGIRAMRACASCVATGWPKSAVIASGPRASSNVWSK